MANRLILRKGSQIAVPTPVLSPQTVSNSEIDLTETYSGPPVAGTYTFQFSTSPSGPFTTLGGGAQTTNVYRSQSLAAATKFYFQANITTTESPPRTSLWSAIVNATTYPTPTQSIKFHPGYYIALDQNATLVQNLTHINTDLAGWQNLVGVFIIKNWGDNNPPSTDSHGLERGMGEYAWTNSDGTPGGINEIQALINEAVKYGFQFMLGVQSKQFSGAPVTTCATCPAYFKDLVCSDGAPGYVLATSQTYSPIGELVATAKNYDPVIAARYGALCAAYGQAFDGNRNFEMFHFADETSNGLYFSDSPYNAQIVQMVSAVDGSGNPAHWAYYGRKYFPTSGVRFTTNFMGGTSETAGQFQTLFNGCIPWAIAVGGPDGSTNLSRTNGATPPVEVGNDLVIFNGAFGGGVSYVNNLLFIEEVQSIRGFDYSSNTPTLATVQSFYLTNGSLAAGGQCLPGYCIFHPWDGVSPYPYSLAQIKALIAGNSYPMNSQQPASYGQQTTYNFYISPTGSDSNPGTLAQPWSINAINTKQSTYAGKSVGVLPGTYNVYQLCQDLFNNNSQQTNALSVNGGTSTPTLIQSTKRGQAILTAANPSGGGYPTVACGIIGQGNGGGPNEAPVPANLGNVIIDGFYITRGYQYGVNFYLPNVPEGSGIQGIEVRNCEIFDISGVVNNNVAGVFLQGTFGAWIHHNKIHSVEPSGGNGQDIAGIFSYYSYSNIYEYNTIYDCTQALRDKFFPNGNHTFRYNYVELNTTLAVFLAAIGDSAGGNGGDVATFNNNIFNVVKAGAQGWYSNFWTLGHQSPGYSWINNTMILPSGAAGPQLLANGTSTGPVICYNNVTKYNGTSVPGGTGTVHVAAGSVVKMDCNLWGAAAAGNANLYQGAPGGGTGYKFSDWQALGYDAHSAAIDPQFNNPTSLNPAGFDLVPGTAGTIGSSFPGYIGGIVTNAQTKMGAFGGFSPPAGGVVGCGY